MPRLGGEQQLRRNRDRVGTGLAGSRPVRRTGCRRPVGTRDAVTSPGPLYLGHDVLGSPEPAPRRRSRRGLAVGLVAGASLGVAGAAVATATYLGGGGAQPEDVLPSSALALVKLDLDPAAGQKLAVYRLAQRFPSTSEAVEDEDSVKDELLSALFAQDDEIDYEADVAPWIGDRVAVALLPGAEEPQPLVALAYTDRDAAEAALDGPVFDGEDDAFFAFSEVADYLLVGTSQEAVDAAAAGTDVLAGSARWEAGMDALDGDQIVTAWADLGAIWTSLPQEARDEAAQTYGLQSDVELSGTLIAGAHAADDHVEVLGRAVDVESPFGLSPAVGGRSDLVAGLPGHTVAALSVTGLGSGLAGAFDQAYGAEDPLGVVAAAADLGLSLPDDLRTLLGDETVVGLFGDSDVGVRARTADADASYDVASSVAQLITGGDPSQVLLRRLEDGIAVGSTPEALDAISATGGGLGASERFRTAVPDAQEAAYVLYVDIPRALEMTGADLGEGADDAAALTSLGISGSGDARSSTFRLRLTVGE